MSEISAAEVKNLREKTGAGMMDCKRALSESSGNFEQAVDWLRKKGLAAAAKKAGRVAAEGLVGVATAGKVGAIVEVNSETDFVARNPQFQSFVAAVSELGLIHDTIETLSVATFPSENVIVNEKLSQLIATIGENMTLRRIARLNVGSGIVASYVHNAVATPTLGKIGVIVALQSAGNETELAALGRQIAMHIAAANPIALDTQSVDSSALERERNILTEQARASGKPDAVISKMVEGRLQKFYEESVLLEQVFVVDAERRIRQVLEDAGKQLGGPVVITGFHRFALGEGIERETTDFAAEVAAARG